MIMRLRNASDGGRSKVSDLGELLAHDGEDELENVIAESVILHDRRADNLAADSNVGVFQV